MSSLSYRFKKSRILSRISHAAKKNDVAGLDTHLIKLFNLLEKDSSITKVLHQHNRSFADLRNMISTLETHGASKIINGQYVPVSSVASLKKLERLLHHWNGNSFEVELMNPYQSNLYLAYDMTHSFGKVSS